MNYQHLNDDERYLIASLKKQRFSLRAIARELGRSPATISREIKRNTQCSWKFGGKNGAHPAKGAPSWRDEEAQSGCLTAASGGEASGAEG